jgi:hypothetical protein
MPGWCCEPIFSRVRPGRRRRRWCTGTLDSTVSRAPTVTPGGTSGSTAHRMQRLRRCPRRCLPSVRTPQCSASRGCAERRESRTQRHERTLLALVPEQQRLALGCVRAAVVVCGFPDVLSMTERPSVDVCSAVRAHRSPLRGVLLLLPRPPVWVGTKRPASWPSSAHSRPGQRQIRTFSASLAGQNRPNARDRSRRPAVVGVR